VEKISVLAITKNGVKIGLSLKEKYASWRIFAPAKFSDNSAEIEWYSEPTAEKIAELFKTNDALICLFSLGAVIRLISPHIKDKKTDPAVLVIDDKKNFVKTFFNSNKIKIKKINLEDAYFDALHNPRSVFGVDDLNIMLGSYTGNFRTLEKISGLKLKSYKEILKSSSLP